MAAEHAHASIPRSDKTWTLGRDYPAFVSGGAMVALPNNFGQIDANYAATSAELQYRPIRHGRHLLRLAAGLRAGRPATFGPRRAGRGGRAERPRITAPPGARGPG